MSLLGDWLCWGNCACTGIGQGICLITEGLVELENSGNAAVLVIGEEKNFDEREVVLDFEGKKNVEKREKNSCGT